MLLKNRRSILHSFVVALNGVAVTFRTQKHMRFHIFVSFFIVLLALFSGLNVREVVVLLFMMTLVITAEMFNSAIEATVDLIQPHYHPLAKTAKDIAAGAVLLTTVLSLVVGAVLFFGESRWETLRANLTSPGLQPSFSFRLILGVFMLFTIIVIGKGLGKRGQVLKGGLVSGHAAFAFFLAIGIMALTDQWLVTALGIILASIVAQSRWEAKIHSVYELVLGATAGTLVGLTIFFLIPK